jgi:hypothetical protein
MNVLGDAFVRVEGPGAIEGAPQLNQEQYQQSSAECTEPSRIVNPGRSHHP